jgi:N-acetylglucosaminyl-diphospho-decaprenol L-rhamnosyltransferase
VRSLRVVIVHWNQPERLAATAAAFRACEDVAVRLTVVDNGSVRRPPAPIADELVDAGANVGFGPAANIGLRRFLADGSDGEWVAVAPHDALPAPGCLRRLLDAVEARPDAGLACADFGDGATPVLDAYLGGILGQQTVAEGWEPAGYPHGTLLLARRSCLQDIGLFDERYFSYGEEADLGARAGDAGWEVGLVRGAIVVNPGLHTAAPEVAYLQLRNTLLHVREHSGRYHAVVRAQLALLQLVVGAACPARRDPFWHAGARLRAVVDHARGRYGPPPASLFSG